MGGSTRIKGATSAGPTLSMMNAGGGFSAPITPTNRQQAVLGFISAGEQKSGFRITGKRKDFLTAYAGKSIRGPMTPGTTGSTIPGLRDSGPQMA